MFEAVAAETVLDQQIETLANLLFAAAIVHHGEANTARERAEIALVRILQRDPALDHFWDVVEALRERLGDSASAKAAAPQPLYAHCVAA